MADTESRQDVVEENMEAVEAQYGASATNMIIINLLKDISISLAMLVDAGGNS